MSDFRRVNCRLLFGVDSKKIIAPNGSKNRKLFAEIFGKSVVEADHFAFWQKV